MKAKTRPKPGYFISLYKRISKQKLRLFRILLIAFLLFLFPSPNIYYLNMNFEKTQETKVLDLPPPPLYPVNISNSYPSFLTAEGIVVIDLRSGVILYSKNPDAKLSPASTTKLMTALVGINHYGLDDVLTVKTVETTRNVMGLVSGEKLTFESLLYGLLVESANDAAVTIAENYPGGKDAFIQTMNRKADSLHLTNTHFANPIGFDDPNQYTTASDLGKLATVALRDKTISKIVATRSITVSDINYIYFHELKNVNQLLGEIPGVAGVKTGYTQNAAECLVTLVRRDNNEILTVVLRSSDRFKETAYLISWVFQNFKWVNIVDYQKTIQANYPR